MREPDSRHSKGASRPEIPGSSPDRSSTPERKRIFPRSPCFWTFPYFWKSLHSPRFPDLQKSLVFPGVSKHFRTQIPLWTVFQANHPPVCLSEFQTEAQTGTLPEVQTGAPAQTSRKTPVSAPGKQTVSLRSDALRLFPAEKAAERAENRPTAIPAKGLDAERKPLVTDRLPRMQAKPAKGNRGTR